MRFLFLSGAFIRFHVDFWWCRLFKHLTCFDHGTSGGRTGRESQWKSDVGALREPCSWYICKIADCNRHEIYIYPHLELIPSRSMSCLWLKLFLSTTTTTTTKTQTCFLLQTRKFPQAPTKTMCVPGGALQRLRPPSGKWPPPQQRWWRSPVVGRARLKVNSQTDPNGTKRPWKKTRSRWKKNKVARKPNRPIACMGRTCIFP